MGNSRFIDYPLSSQQKNMIEPVIRNLFLAKPEAQEEIILQLHKILANYRILIPHAINTEIEGVTLIDWLLSSANNSKRKYKLLLSLTLNNNLLIRSNK